MKKIKAFFESLSPATRHTLAAIVILTLNTVLTAQGVPANVSGYISGAAGHAIEAK